MKTIFSAFHAQSKGLLANKGSLEYSGLYWFSEKLVDPLLQLLFHVGGAD